MLAGGSTGVPAHLGGGSGANRAGASLRVIPKQNHGIKRAALRPMLVELFS